MASHPRPRARTPLTAKMDRPEMTDAEVGHETIWGRVLVVACCLLVVGCWFFVGCWLLVVGCCVFIVQDEV